MRFTEKYSRDQGVHSLEVSAKKGEPWRLVSLPKTSGGSPVFAQRARMDGHAFGGDALDGVIFFVEGLPDRPGFKITSQAKDAERLAKRDMRKWLSCAVDLVRESSEMSARANGAKGLSWLHEARERGLLPQEEAPEPKKSARAASAPLEAMITPEQMVAGVKKVVGAYAAEQFGLFLKERERQRQAELQARSEREIAAPKERNGAKAPRANR